MKCADIPDAAFLEVVRTYNDGEFPATSMRDAADSPFDGRWAFVWDVAEILGVPGKLAEAKAYILIRRGLMDGCDARHWCRGDYTVLDTGRAVIEAADPAAVAWRNPAPVSLAESGDNPHV